MNILETIVAQKKKEVASRKLSAPVQVLERSDYFMRKPFSLKASLLDDTKTGIIAEFKRRSPSKGLINGHADIRAVTAAYAAHGASCLSVLTDADFFGGSTEDLLAAREQLIPVLRKDFIVDEYQVLEAKAMGADVILLIAACLTVNEVRTFSKLGTGLQMEVLLELHDEKELDHICSETAIIGINNRNLKTFQVDLDHSLKMAARLPAGSIKIAESGISEPATVQMFRENGFHGFLMGENFMKEADPGQAFAKFAQTLKPAPATGRQ